MERNERRWAVPAGVVLALGLAAWPARAGFLDTLKGLLGQAAPASQGLSSPQIAQGLLEALRLGTERAVARASAVDGFLGNPTIRVPLPPAVEQVSGMLRSVGLGGQVGAFETALNRGAEKAAAGAVPIFADALGRLTFTDVERIFRGGDTAATEYFRGQTSEALLASFLPVVHSATREVGLARAYGALTGNPLARLAWAGADPDLDRYVAGKALEGLFTLVGEEEKRIRTDPLARTTDLVRQVFGR